MTTQQPTIPDKNINKELRFKYIEPRCATCKNTDPHINVQARWHTSQQQWIAHIPSTTTHHCPKCGPTTLEWKTIED